MGFNTKKEKRAKYDFYDFSLFLCRKGAGIGTGFAGMSAAA